MKLPTDRKILETIYAMYVDEFTAQPAPILPYLAIDVPRVAAELDCHASVLFGRLYYNLANKHWYRAESGLVTTLFAVKAGEASHAIQFPYLAGVLADMKDKERRESTPWLIAGISVLVAVGSLVWNVVSAVRTACGK